MAITLIDTLIGWAGDTSSATAIWCSQSQADKDGEASYEYADGDLIHTPGTKFHNFTGEEFMLLVSSFEHGGVDGMFPSVFVNRRHDRIIPVQAYACGQLYARPPSDIDAPGPGGNGDGHRVEYHFNPPAGEYRIGQRYGSWGTGANQSVFVNEPIDPIHEWDDGGHSVALLFSGVQKNSVGTIIRTPLSRVQGSSTDPISLTVDTPHPDDHVLDVLLINRGVPFTMEPAHEEQEVLFVHETGDKYPGFAEAPYFDSVGIYLQYYISIRPRAGDTTPVGWDFVTGSGSNCAIHVAIPVRAA